MTKIGRKEQEIIDHLQKNDGKVGSVELTYKFAPFYRKAGDRTGSTLVNVVWKRLRNMEKKGLVEIHNPSRTSCFISLPHLPVVTDTPPTEGEKTR